MKVYRTDEIRNVVLLGHGGCGKTSLVEAMAYVSGASNRMGKVSDGNTISDFDKEVILISSARRRKQPARRMRRLSWYPEKRVWKSGRKRRGSCAISTTCLVWYM